MQWFDTPKMGAEARVWALGLTFADHMRETGEWSDKPVVFAKKCGPTLGGGVIQQPSQQALHQAIRALNPALQKRLSADLSEWPALLDYEVEMGLILLQDWSPGQPMPRVGYVLVNDVTARSIQIAGLGAADALSYWSAAKGFDGFLPMSSQMACPVEAEADRWPDVVLRTRVNGQVRQQSALQNLLYSPLEVLTHAAQQSGAPVLRKHDVVLSGTPAGIALQVPKWKRVLASWLPSTMAIRTAWRSQARNPQFLKPGDTVEVSADGFGTLTSSIEGAV